MSISPKCRSDDYLFTARHDWLHRGHLVGGKRGAVMGGIGSIGVIVGRGYPDVPWRDGDGTAWRLGD